MPFKPLTLFRRFLTASAEQRAVIEHCLDHNVLCTAVPGSGKTTTAELLVRANPRVPIAVVTYSKRLQVSTQQRLAEYPNADAYTFHGLATTLFRRVIHNDNKLRSLRKENLPPALNTPNYRYIVFDELQDGTSDLFWLASTFVSAVTRHSGSAPNLLVLGDARQAIYQFRGADARYLQRADTIFARLSPYPWARLQLAQSFRLTRQTVDFVNNAFLGGEEDIMSTSNGPKPIYLHASLFDAQRLREFILPLVRKYGAENCAIITPFVRNNEWLAELCNKLTYDGVPLSISAFDDVPLDEDVLRGKMAVATWHQFKGSERDCVFVFGVDAHYFEFIARDIPDNRCPNPAFVALTRARKQLVVVQAQGKKAMPFVDWNAVLQHAEYINLAKVEPTERDQPGRPVRLGLLLPRNVSASEMARHVRDDELEEVIRANAEIIEIAAPTSPNICDTVPHKVRTNPELQHYEAVADINGLVVTAALELGLRGSLRSFGHKQSNPLPKIPVNPRKRAIWLVRDAVRYEAEVSGYKSRDVQMHKSEHVHHFAWLAANGGKLLGVAVQRLQDEVLGIAKDEALLEFERQFCRSVKVYQEQTMIRGQADIVFEEVVDGVLQATIWEVKFVAALSLEHVAQAVAYAHMWWEEHLESRNDGSKSVFPRIVLLNVRTGEKWEIVTTAKGARKLVEEILRAKYTAKGEMSEELFLDDAGKVVKSVERRLAQHLEQSSA